VSKERGKPELCFSADDEAPFTPQNINHVVTNIYVFLETIYRPFWRVRGKEGSGQWIIELPYSKTPRADIFPREFLSSAAHCLQYQKPVYTMSTWEI
jgi:hypothetical protein